MHPPSQTRIALLGIGMMGLPVAQRLCEAGHEVHVWNRTRAKAEPLAAAGATVSTYEDFVAHVEALRAIVPSVDAACLIASMPRPLRVMKQMC